MSIARAVLLRASRSRWLANQVRRRGFARRAVRRFMPGEEMSAALEATASFSSSGVGTVLTHLGEQVQTREEVEGVRRHYLHLLDELHARGLTAQISVKLTHLGLDLDAAQCEQGLVSLVARAKETNSMVWIDMEESWYVDATLELFRSVRGRYPQVGVCLQSYLLRTPADLESLLPLAPAVRLVKGAYREAPDIAFARKRDTDAAFLELATRLLENSPAGAIPVFGTHDPRLIDRIRERARVLELDDGRYEVHMLYGIQPRFQRDLASGGVAIRVLISYGENWFPWYMRRLAERPANLWFVVRNLIDRPLSGRSG